MNMKLSLAALAFVFCHACAEAQTSALPGTPTPPPPTAAAEPPVTEAVAPLAAVALSTAPSQQTPAPPAVTASSSPVPAQAVAVSSAAPYQSEISTQALVAQKKGPPVLLSGIVLMPTAYRSTGRNSLGLNLDINAAYYIGRLYGKNSYSWNSKKENYLDRIGLWVLSADAKMLVQTEEGWRPAVATGVLGMFTLRDSGQPKLDNPTVQVNVDTSNKLASAYAVMSKRFKNKYIFSLGYMEGTIPNMIPSLSEFLTDAAMTLNGQGGQSATSRSMAFGGIIWLPRPDRPLGLEIMVPQGAPGHPKLFNLHLGTLLKMNFELSYLNYDGGWDLLGMFQFRYNYYPKR